MKTLILFMVVLGTLAANADLQKFLGGFLEGLGIQENKQALLKCADDLLWQSWEETISRVRVMAVDDPTKVPEWIGHLLRGPQESIGFLARCSESDLQKYYEYLKSSVESQSKFLAGIGSHAQIILDHFKALLDPWDKSNYVEAGIKAGQLTLAIYRQN